MPLILHEFVMLAFKLAGEMKIMHRFNKEKVTAEEVFLLRLHEEAITPVSENSRTD
jgi:hypothetical protein